MMPRAVMLPSLRFWAKVNKSSGPIPSHRVELGACWLWTGGKSLDGYGRFRVGRASAGTIQAHRWPLETFLGRALREGTVACHHCDNPSCVRPEHLFEGTQLENERDKQTKGRTPRGERHGRHTRPEATARGSRSGRAKLTEAQVLAIRDRVACGESQAAIARSLGVTPTIVSRILRGKIWKHLANSSTA